ncbi:type I phosphomannose isomerase catalytic subunit [Candidatus Latescibacterota bacterium]
MGSLKTTRDLYPLRCREILRDYGFGERWIVSEFDKEGLPDDHRVAETWEVCDRPGESSLILNGDLAGRTLRDAIDTWREDLLGTDVVTRFGTTFPLLIKLLDASNVLGEHLHPGDDLVRQRGLDDFSGKTEAWYMLRARPDATIHCGHRPGVTVDALRQAMLEDRPRDCMEERPATVGDAFLLYPGTIHYSSGGLLFYEIMQNSDINIGLRPARGGEPSLEARTRADEILEGVHFEDGFDPRTRPVAMPLGANCRTFLIACQHFAVERLDLAEPHRLDMRGDRFRVATIVEGAATVAWDGGAETLKCGQSCLLPAALGAVSLEPDRDAAALLAFVPDLVADVVAPLRAAGITDEAIRGLGGHSELNPLNALATL